MGTTTFLVMADTRPEYQEFIYMANLLAPVVIRRKSKNDTSRGPWLARISLVRISQA